MSILYVQISVGSVHVMAVTEDGQVYAWGTNHDGQLGTGDTRMHVSTNLECSQFYFDPSIMASNG